MCVCSKLPLISVRRSPLVIELSVAGVADSHWFLGRRHLGLLGGALVAENVPTVPTMVLQQMT